MKTQVSGNGADLIVNLEDVTLVDVQTVRFLGACQQGGIKLRNCPLYVQEWIIRERAAKYVVQQLKLTKEKRNGTF